MDYSKKRFLEELSYRFPTVAKASAEIINLSASLSLPKETEHFMTDIHGEYEQFDHIMRNCSGAIKSKIDDVFGNSLSPEEKSGLATLIYYPEEKTELAMQSGINMHDWYYDMLLKMISMARRAGIKYTRSKVRSCIEPDFAFIIEELMTENDAPDKSSYYNGILEAIISTGRAGDCIKAFAYMIQRLSINHLHIIGDIYDRGPGPDIVIEKLMQVPNVDIQWGNHDVVWMGAACGNMTCIATVLRLCARYGNLDTIEDGYGINLIPLLHLALKYYDRCDTKRFRPKFDDGTDNSVEMDISTKMHKAAAILQFKLEGQAIMRHPDFNMDDRLLLHRIDYENRKITLYGETYDIEDADYPTVDLNAPYSLNDDEAAVMQKLRNEFLNCGKLQRHMHFLLNKGSLYLIYNSTLLFHGSIPLNEDGSLLEVRLDGKPYRGRALMDELDRRVRNAYFMQDGPLKEDATDIFWFLWTNEASPLFGKKRMTTYERYFINDKASFNEPKTPYYKLYDDESVIDSIFREFGLDPSKSHIVNGHVPIKQRKGESPIKCGGKLLMIDGGFSRAYQATTGIAGYTLISNSYGFKLVYHEPFTSREDAILNCSDIRSELFVEKNVERRQTVADTDDGRAMRAQIEDLRELLDAYRTGQIRERG